ncbi:TIGR03826 family flagellar region protein [Brevibacillus sp. GCM10020057]|uniref:TIGR03826 family flagellar region protein n=1 Tax=Brevibacillus sp. GCM10020057 TaxID=3317327 RepID=UPI0036459452
MSLGKLANCSRCDALFVQAVRDICPKCYQTVEQEYERCARFLRKRENRGSNIYQVSEATNVSVKQITKFIKEGRITVAGNPNLAYPCEGCGTALIQTGTLCESCINNLKHDITQQLEVDQRLKEEKQAESRTIAYQRRQNADE